MTGVSQIIGALSLAALLPQAVAHIALWHPSMYGWNDTEPNQNDADNPLAFMNFTDWWFHGWIDRTPDPGQVMELPAGGVFHGEVSCSKAFTTEWGYYPEQEYACPTLGPLHTTDQYGDWPVMDVMGCGLGIAYKSDVYDIQPEDFTMISVNYTCPWTRSVDFPIPADLPACPPGGCHCMWGWVHAPDAGSTQIYFLGYRCNVTGATGTVPLPAPQVARKCPTDKTNCTVGSKQPHYWLQNERNNNFQGNFDPPYYNDIYGFQNGAQTDLWDAVSTTPVYTVTATAPGFWDNFYGLRTPSASDSVTSSASASTSTSVTPASVPAVTTSVITTPSVPASLPIPTVSTQPVTTSTTVTSASSSPSAATINTSATQMGSPTFVTSAVMNGVASPSPSLLSIETQCQKPLSARALKRLEDPQVRKLHDMRAERRRERRALAATDGL